MPTNANTFNSRVTSEALEEKFRQVFPSQGGAELTQDLFASGVIQPVIDFSSVAEGSVLAPNLQTAWDFATGHRTVENASTTIVNNTGFWQVDLSLSSKVNGFARLYITDGLTTKTIWEMTTNDAVLFWATDNPFVVFLRAGDSLVAQSNLGNIFLNVWYRQIADVNGTLVNPLGFTFS